MNGFIGGALGKVDDKVVVFGDLSKIDKKGLINQFVKQNKLELIDFKDLDIIDYGGIIIIFV